ncbi:MAG: hypothetical protein AAF483_28430 [Planctomycetota bacterium]
MLWKALLTLWLAIVLSGLAGVTVYSTAIGRTGKVPEHWPETESIETLPGEGRLLVFLHPKCPCSRATVRELQRILVDKDTPRTEAIIYIPKQASTADQSWFRTDLIVSASKVSTVRWDVDGALAKEFGALTSGHTLLFDAQGKRVFSGGVTSGRGHEGESPGKLALMEILSGSKKSGEYPVFGCPIVAEQGDIR